MTDDFWRGLIFGSVLSALLWFVGGITIAVVF